MADGDAGHEGVLVPPGGGGDVRPPPQEPLDFRDYQESEGGEAEAEDTSFAQCHQHGHPPNGWRTSQMGVVSTNVSGV